MSKENVISEIEMYIEHIYSNNSFDNAMVVNLTDTIAKAVSKIDSMQTNRVNEILENLLYYIGQEDVVGIKDCLEYGLKQVFKNN